MVTVDIENSQLSNFERLHARPYADSVITDVICKMCLMKVKREEEGMVVYLWTLSTPGRVLYLWDVTKKCVLLSYSCDNYPIETSEGTSF